MCFNLSKKLQLTILLFTLLFVSSSYSCADSKYMDEKLKVIHDKSFPISPGNDFKLDASSGDVLISSWNKNEVHVKILGNDKAKEKVEFNFNESEDMIEVEAKYDWSLFMLVKGVELRFEVQVPKEFNIEAYTSGGDIKLQNVKGKVALKTSGGDINVADLNGNVEVSTSGGDITFNNSYGELNFSTSGGDIKGNKFSGKLEVSTSGGDITLLGSDAVINGSTSGGDISLDYSGQNQGIELSTSGGDIAVKLPKNVGASANLSTLGGDIKSDFKGNNAVNISSTKFEADINNGGNPLVLKTTGGDIVVKKK
ncbi:MAG TPA: DUF4097 family beta strand repeat-containing protein [Ignavibacteriaceae bacterium]